MDSPIILKKGIYRNFDKCLFAFISTFSQIIVLLKGERHTDFSKYSKAHFAF